MVYGTAHDIVQTGEALLCGASSSMIRVLQHQLLMTTKDSIWELLR